LKEQLTQNKKGGKIIKLHSAHQTRLQALLGGNSKIQREKYQEEVEELLKDMDLSDNCEQYREFMPKDDNDYKKLFKDWMREFHAKYLALEKIHYFQKIMFYVKGFNF
jgi:hypothetical protein